MITLSGKKWVIASGPERLIALSDGVFSIAITLLIFNVKMPEVNLTGQSEQLLLNALLDTGGQLIGYVIGFLVVGLFWLAHHRIFSYIKNTDRRLLFLNLLFLMCIAYLPFPTGILAKYGNTRVAVITYALSVALTGVMLFIVWWYASFQHRLVDKKLEKKEILYTNLRLLSASLIFLLSIPISFIDPTLAMWSWLFISLLSRLLSRFFFQQQEEEDEPEVKTSKAG